MPSEHSLKKLARSSTMLAVFTIITISSMFFGNQFQVVHATGPTLSIKPSSGQYSNKLITITGNGYAAYEMVQLYWNYTGPGTGTLETSVNTNAAGVFTTRFPIPLAATNTYTIAGVGKTSGLIATCTFQLLPTISARGSVGVSGSPLVVNGYAFGAAETVNIYWNYSKGNGTFLTSVASDSTGSFTTTITIPTSPSSGFSVVAGVGQSSHKTASYPLTIYAQTLALAPLSGAANSTLTISAYGFTPQENVNIYWNGGSTPVLTSSTNGFGYLALLAFTIPVGTAVGTYTVSAVGQTSHTTITNTYSVVAPASSLSIQAAPIGTQVLVTGQGYTASEPVDILWNYTGPGTGTVLATINAGYSGTIHGNFIVPATTTGTYSLGVVGRISQSASQQTFSVINGLAASPTKLSPESNVTVTGTGYQTNEAVNIYWNSASGPLLATATADTNGNINQAITIPANATIGSNSLVGIGQTSLLTFNAPITVAVDWSDFGFDSTNHRSNPFEQQIGTSNVGNLVSKWKVTVSKALQASPVVANGLVYVTTTDGQLVAYNATTGNIVWRYNSNTGFPNYSSALVDPATNSVFFGTIADPIVGLPSPFYALDAQTGVLKWSVILPWDEDGFPTLGLNTIYVGTSDEGGPAGLMALDEVSGRVNWQYATVAGVWGAVGVDPSAQEIFTGIGNPTDAIIALNAITGALIWQYNVPQYGPDNDVGSAILIDQGRVYTDSKNGYFYALNESDGSLAWSTLVGSRSGGNISSAALANGVIYVGSRDKNLYALRESDGSITWKTPTGADIFSSPAVANGIVYVASVDNKIYAMDAASGSVLWSFTTGGKAYGSPVIVNGLLYCTSTDQHLYAFGL